MVALKIFIHHIYFYVIKIGYQLFTLQNNYNLYCGVVVFNCQTVAFL